jgi:hypothetical protein
MGNLFHQYNNKRRKWNSGLRECRIILEDDASRVWLISSKHEFQRASEFPIMSWCNFSRARVGFANDLNAYPALMKPITFSCSIGRP